MTRYRSCSGGAKLVDHRRGGNIPIYVAAAIMVPGLVIGSVAGEYTPPHHTNRIHHNELVAESRHYTDRDLKPYAKITTAHERAAQAAVSGGGGGPGGKGPSGGGGGPGGPESGGGSVQLPESEAITHPRIIPPIGAFPNSPLNQ